MGAKSGQPDSSLTVSGPSGESLPERLRERPFDFSFYQAVRLLTLIAGTRQPIGSFVSPHKEPVRLAVHPSLSFPAAEIQDLTEVDEGPHKMLVNFFGLTGALGVLPTRYTEMIIERRWAKDTTLRDFLDLFNHRLLSLLYRAWEKPRFPVSYERSGEDNFTGYLFDLIGLGTAGLRNRQAVPDQVLLGYQGLLAQSPRSATAFQQLLQDYFQVPVEVQPFSGTWRPLDRSSRTCLGDTYSQSEQLGVGIVLGDEVWDQESVVRVCLGPMPLDKYQSFLPDGDAFEPLKSISRFFCGDDLDVEVQLILRREDAPRFALDAPGMAPPRLGWFSWVFTRPLDRDPNETILRLWDE